jgi:hypothetical protein
MKKHASDVVNMKFSSLRHLAITSKRSREYASIIAARLRPLCDSVV